MGMFMRVAELLRAGSSFAASDWDMCKVWCGVVGCGGVGYVYRRRG